METAHADFLSMQIQDQNTFMKTAASVYFGFILIAISVFSHAGNLAATPLTNQAACTSQKDTADQLQLQLEQSRVTLANIKAFIAGSSLGDTPAASLFIVDLTDDQAIERRVESLRTQLDSDIPAPSISSMLKCAETYPQLAQSALDLAKLKVSIARVRLDFLSLPKDRRNALLNAQQTLLSHAKNANALAREQRVAEKQRSAASQSVETAELRARSAETADLREIASQRALLEKVREEIASLKIEYSTDLQARANFYHNTVALLPNLAGSLTQANTPKNILQAYLETAEIWRSLVDQVFTRITDPQHYAPIPDLPAMPNLLIGRLGNNETTKAYKTAYLAAQNELNQLHLLHQEGFAKERNNVFRLLLETSKLRSELLKENVALGNIQVTSLTQTYLMDLYRELRISPYRLYAFVTTKLIDFREKSNSGIEGLLDIMRQLLMLAFFIAIPFMVYHVVRWAAARLEELRRQMLREQIKLPESRQRNARITTIVIQRFNLYLPWLVMLLGIWLAESLIKDTVFAEAAALLPYLTYFIWFRIFVIFVSGILGVIAYTGTLQGLTARRKRLQHTAKSVGAFFFISLALLHATQDVVGEALVYRIVSDGMFYIGLIILAIVARQWRPEIISASNRVLPVWAVVRLEQYCSGWLSWLMCLPAMILVMIGLMMAQVNGWAGQTDMFKRIGAELFRRRIESAIPDKAAKTESSDRQPPEEYLQWFDLGAPTDESLLIKPSSGVVANITRILDTWRHSSGGEHSLAIVGDKGSGKSSLLRVLENNCTYCHIIKITVPPKLITRDAVLAFFAEQLQQDMSHGADSLLALDKAHDATLILVDEAHNMFLGAIDGFDGYRTFMELVNASTSNLFWCATFNQRSWDYLRGVFVSNQYFRNMLTIPPLSDADIQNLILTRHQRTNFTLSYDVIIRATQSPEEFGGMAHIETQFFRLLWGQSNGNPRAAIVLWTSALHTHGNKRLRVGIPLFKTIRGAEQAGDNALFVYATIIRHENLTEQEIVASTDIPTGEVKDAIRIGIDIGAIVQGSDQRYRVSPTAQFAMINLLMGKNFLYE